MTEYLRDLLRLRSGRPRRGGRGAHRGERHLHRQRAVHERRRRTPLPLLAVLREY